MKYNILFSLIVIVMLSCSAAKRKGSIIRGLQTMRKISASYDLSYVEGRWEFYFSEWTHS
jgi:hypothetical protein